MNTNKGMSLIEVLVAVGIMSIMSFAIMDMVSNQNKAIKSTQHSLDVAEAVNQAQRYLVDSNICKSTLENINFLPNQNTPITEIRRGPAPYTILLTSANGHINKKIGGVEIVSFVVRRINTTPELQLTMNLRKSVAGSSFGSQTFSKTIKLSARFKTTPASQVNQIETCYTEFDNGVTSALQAACADICPTCTWNTNTLKCVRPSAATTPKLFINPTNGAITTSPDYELGSSNNCNCYYPTCPAGQTEIRRWCDDGGLAAYCGLFNKWKYGKIICRQTQPYGYLSTQP